MNKAVPLVYSQQDELNVTANATDSSQTQADMPVANTGAANPEPQEQTP